MSANFIRFPLAAAAIASIIFFMNWLVQSNYFSANPDLIALAITLDMTITIPLLYYLAIRKTNLPKISVVAVFIAAVYITLQILPEAQRHYADMMKLFVLPLLEAGVLSYIGWTVYKIRRTFTNQDTHADKDFQEIFRASAGKVLGVQRLADIITTEVAVFYYLIHGWKAIDRTATAGSFSYHRKNGLVAIIYVLIFLILLETIALHLLISQWSITAAWIVTALSIYSGIYLLGYYHSTKCRPIQITSEGLKLRNGLLAEVSISFSEIAGIELSSRSLPEDEKPLKLMLLGNHNIVIHLKNPLLALLVYGFRQPFDKVLLFVDQKNDFFQMVKEKLAADPF